MVEVLFFVQRRPRWRGAVDRADWESNETLGELMFCCKIWATENQMCGSLSG